MAAQLSETPNGAQTYFQRDENRDTRDAALEKVRSTATVTMSPELFEKLYLAPQTTVKGDLRQAFGNPTPLGLIGFVVGLTPLACSLMGWRGAGGLGAANIGVFLFIGGPLQLLAGILEFFLGNTFPFAVFATYGCVFFALGATLQPFYNSAGAYSASGSFAEGLQEPVFNATLAYFPLAVGCLNIIFMICATKINAIFFCIFTGAGLGFFFLASALWILAEKNTIHGHSILVACGAAWFGTAVFGWYLLLAQMLSVVGFGVNLPVGDFSRVWNRRMSAVAVAPQAGA